MTRKSTIRNRRPSDKKKNKYVAAALAFFAGMFGVHKFYLEKPIQGVFYVFMFVFLIGIFNFPFMMIIGFIDAMILLFMSTNRFNELYNPHLELEGSNTRSVPQQRSNRPVRSRTSRTSSRTKRRNPFKISGEKKYEDYDIKGAIEDFRKAVDVAPDDNDLHFKLARAYSLNENKDLGLYHLSEAVKYGYSDLGNIMEEDDLAYLRIQKEFDMFKENGYRLAPSSMNQPKEVPDDVLLSQLNKLAELKSKGLLSEKEFLLEKQKIMKR